MFGTLALMVVVSRLLKELVRGCEGKKGMSF